MDNIIDPPRMPDYYRDLGISQKATPATIRKAFNVLALATHPDKNHNNNTGNSDNAAGFRKVREAYEYLSNPKKRAGYDEQYLYIRAAWERYHEQQATRSRREQERLVKAEEERRAAEAEGLRKLEERKRRSREYARKAWKQHGRAAKRKIGLQKDAAAEARLREVAERRRGEQEKAREHLGLVHLMGLPRGSHILPLYRINN
ncbi:DnaJ domain-containing protein [Xylaria scruposa]|nr:DnaJ domain-containing protein [Xylaria scruposa]